MQRVYLETSVPSYLAARPSRNLLVAGHQQVTQDWWDQRARFELFVSDAVISECSRGDSEAVRRRLAVLDDIAVLSPLQAAFELAQKLLADAALPEKAAIDALHISIAAVHGMDYLLTWNCAHIANAERRPQIEEICRRLGFRPPVICTPLELLKEESS